MSRNANDNLSDAEKYFFYRLYNEQENLEREAEIVGKQFGDEDIQYLEMMLKKNEELSKTSNKDEDNQKKNDIMNDLKFWQTHHHEFVQFLLRLIQRERLFHHKVFTFTYVYLFLLSNFPLQNRHPLSRRLNPPMKHLNSEEFNQRGPVARRKSPLNRRRMFVRRFPKAKTESINMKLQDSFQRIPNKNQTSNSKKKVRYSIFIENENDTNATMDLDNGVQYDNSTNEMSLKEKLKDILEEQGFNVILTDYQDEIDNTTETVNVNLIFSPVTNIVVCTQGGVSS